MKQLVTLIIIFGFIGCYSSDIEVIEVDYSFFAAGHTYGNPIVKPSVEGIYKPFKEKFQFINEDVKIELGFLLGDVVRAPSHWDVTEKELLQLNASINIARGNHDGALEPFEKRFGKSYKSFIKNEDLFIILDPNLDEWNISGEQLLFLKNELRNKGKNAKNIFILMHQIIWWTTDKYSKPFPNSIEGRGINVNYWTEIEPLFVKSNKPVFIFGGDLGAYSSEERKANYPVEYSYFQQG